MLPGRWRPSFGSRTVKLDLEAVSAAAAAAAAAAATGALLGLHYAEMVPNKGWRMEAANKHRCNSAPAEACKNRSKLEAQVQEDPEKVAGGVGEIRHPGVGQRQHVL